MALGILPVAVLVPALATSVRTLIDKWRARRDLSMAVAKSGPEGTRTLNALVQANDLPGVVAFLRGHLETLPPQEQAQAVGALLQTSEAGRRNYAMSVLESGLPQAGA